MSANIDIVRGHPRIVETEPPLYRGVAFISLNEDYGFHVSNVGCLLSQSEAKGIGIYNSQVEKYLIKRNGKGWRNKYQEEIKALIKRGLIE